MDSLRIRVLGQLEVQGLIHRDIGSRKGRSLLTALAAARGEPVSADLLAELLWHDQLPANPAEQLQVLVSRLRSSLGIEGIERIGSGYRLVYDWLDLDELEQLADESATRLAAGATASARAAATTALRLVRGTPLAEESGAWADTERRRIDRLITSARTTAAESALASGNLLDAIRLAENALEFDRFDEPALRVLMLAHVSAGRPAAALAVYATTREHMAEELGVSPTDATESLHSHILLGTVPVPFATASKHDDGLVGREPQLAMLDREFDQAAGGPARLVVISGEPGIGKSALLEAWSERVMVAGALVIGICGDPTGRDLPLQPLFDALATRLQPSGPVASRDEQPQATYVGDQAPLHGQLYVAAHAPRCKSGRVAAPVPAPMSRTRSSGRRARPKSNALRARRTPIPGPTARWVRRTNTPRRQIASQPRRTFACPVAPPPEFVIVAKSLLPGELDECSEQAQVELRGPPRRRRHAVLFERRPKRFDCGVFRLG